MKDYQITKTTELKELNAILTELVHTQSGARIMHIKNDDPENLFCLSFQTIPNTSNGVAHILEHTVLCGSRKYPIKDPFFAMTRRSLHTFMNAMTGSDFTCYPASSQVEKDFYNLLEVYLDAVFYPTLHPYCLLQEGIRLEFKEPTNPESPLEYKGIVFNEMKGALASGSARLAEMMNAALYPAITYGINSGGDPKVIPELTYERLKEFHETYYHPSQCIFFFYGNLPLEQHLDFIHDKVLKNVGKTPALPPIPLQPRFKTPKKIEATYPVPAGSTMEDKTFISFGWVTTHIKDTLDTIAMTTLILVLMDNDASILKQALLKSGLCKQATAYVDNEMTEAPFILTMRGVEAQAADGLEKIILDTLKKVVDQGIPNERIESVIHQLELSRSEITGDSHPYGLSLYLRSALLCHHGVEPEEGLLVHKVFDALREKIKEDQNYLSSLISKHLLDNPHRVRIVMTPSQDMEEKEIAEETARLSAIAAHLTAEEKQALLKQTESLKAYQTELEEQDLDVLPKVTLQDVPTESKVFPLQEAKVGNLKVYTHETFTNFIAYMDLVYDLPNFDEADMPYLRLLSTVLSQMGSGGKNYVETLHEVQEYTGGIGTALSFNLQVSDAKTFTPSLHIRGKGLYRNKEMLFRLVKDLVTEVDWKDEIRFKEILDKHVTGLIGSVQQSALRYAMNLASSPLTGCSKLVNIWFGLDYVTFAKSTLENIPATINKLKVLYSKILTFAVPSLIVTADKDFLKEGSDTGFWELAKIPVGRAKPLPWNLIPVPLEPQGRMIASQVAFTAKTLGTIPLIHPDSPILQVAAHLFDNVTLHAKIREQGGAYGGGASCSSSSATFCFYAYRDPNLSSTIEAFQAAIDNVLEGEFDEEDLDEAKLEIIQGLDSPVSPGSRGDVAYGWLKDGKSKELIQAYREKVLSATKEDVMNTVKIHIAPYFKDAPVVSFAGKELLEKENETLEPKLKLLLAE